MTCAASAATPTDVLRAEHRLIEHALDVLAHLAEQARAAGAVPRLPVRDLLEFLRTFADACHHAKEERILFPALERVVPGFGPAVVMRHEHEQARAHTASLHRAFEQNDAAAFAKAAGAYVELLRGHIHKEDHCLWPMADQLLSAETQAEILRAFATAESEDVGDGVHERMIEALDRLLATCGLPPRRSSSLARNSGGCGCGGNAAGKGGAS